MFETTRIKLTAWYLLIIMTISVTFSLVIYAGVNRELERFARIQRFRFEPIPFVDPELLNDTRRRIITILTMINAFILIAAGGLGYILSGKTLEPIQQMLDDQQQFISNASHELRTPLAALKSSLEVNLRDSKLTLKEAKSQMSEQLNKVNELQALSDGLLNVLHHQGNIDRNFILLSLHSVISKAITEVQPLAVAKNIHITANKTNINLEGDSDSLFRLCLILLDNAIKYSPNDTVITIISEKKKGYAKLKVIDQGIGIKKSDLPHIFDRFFRADQARNHATTNGFGLGLAIAKEIVDHHHGSIKITSKVNQGSTCTVTIPLKQK